MYGDKLNLLIQLALPSSIYKRKDLCFFSGVILISHIYRVRSSDTLVANVVVCLAFMSMHSSALG